MASERRMEQLNILLKEELAKILDREIEFPEGALVTITRVEVSPDVHYAKVLISTYGAHAERVLEILQKNVYTIQQKLNRYVRMRPVPRIRFALDEEEERRENVEKSLSQLKQKGEV